MTDHAKQASPEYHVFSSPDCPEEYAYVTSAPSHVGVLTHDLYAGPVKKEGGKATQTYITKRYGMAVIYPTHVVQVHMK